MKPLYDVTESKSSPLPGLSSGIVPLRYVLRPPILLSNPTRAHLMMYQVRR